MVTVHSRLIANEEEERSPLNTNQAHVDETSESRPCEVPELDPDVLISSLNQCLKRGLDAAAQGIPSTQVPGLEKVDPKKFGISLTLLDGTTCAVGDSEEPFSMQSVSKLFALTTLLTRLPDSWNQIGWEPTQASFKSLSVLEMRDGHPQNPFVNAGALVVTDLLISSFGDGLDPTLKQLREQSGNKNITVDESIAEAEFATSHINNAVAHLLAGSGRIDNSIEEVLMSYFRQCAIAASATDISRAAIFLADRSPKIRVLEMESRRRVNAVLLTAGAYNAAGDVAYRVGLPVKSGIGGGVVGVLPGVGTICAWSPPLDDRGNSVGALAALEDFSRRTGWSLF